jgi:hypothetical protein
MPKRNQPRTENSRRLAALLERIRTDILGLGRADMALRLGEVCRNDAFGTPVANFTQDLVLNLERMEIGIRYVHLETYGRLLGVPSGIILLISRFSTDRDDEADIMDLEKLLQGLLVVCAVARAENRSLGAQDFKSLSDIVAVERPQRGRPVSQEDLPPDATTIERLRAAKRLSEKRGFDPLRGLALFEPKSEL